VAAWPADRRPAVLIAIGILRRKLKVGGVLYISYNTQPGWAAMVPVRDLMAQHADVLAAPRAGVTLTVNGTAGLATLTEAI
jgi:hypothetical protein